MAAGTIDPQMVIDLAGVLNFKQMLDIGLQDELDHKRRTNGILESAMGKTIEALHSIDVGEGLGIAAAQRSDNAKVVSEFGSVIAAMKNMLEA